MHKYFEKHECWAGYFSCRSLKQDGNTQTNPSDFGKPMIIHLIDEAFKTNCHPVTVVLGANKEKIVPVLEGIPVTLVDNPFGPVAWVVR